MASSSSGTQHESADFLQAPATGVMRFIPLGGVGEIGKNLSLIEVGNDVMVIDAGLAFPEAESPGVDVILPDVSFLRTRRERLRAVVLTHGHEDHIGALPFFLEELAVPIYGTRLTLGLLRNKLERRGFTGRAELCEVAPGETISVGSMRVEFIHMTHSVPGSCGLSITTPAGRILHTGDFKLDQTPVDSRPPDLARIAELGAEGVDLLLSDSTNAQVAGVTASELTVRPALERALADSPGRVLVVTFASNLARIRQTMELAQAANRRCCIVGRSMLRNVGTGRDLGYLTIGEQLPVNPRELRSIPDRELCLLATGSQGEPLAALSRIASGLHPFIRLRPTDTVVLAANPVPGNEAVVGRILNQLVEHGVRVLAGTRDGVHASGHAAQEELRFVLRLVQPRCFVPVHGEPRHLAAHARLAEESGLEPSSIEIVGNGSVVEVAGGKIVVRGSVTSGAIPIDGDGRRQGPEHSRRETRSSGLVVVSVTMDRKLERLVAGPDTAVSGVDGDRARQQLVEGAKGKVDRALRQRRRGFNDSAELRELMRQLVSAHLEHSSWRPTVVAVVSMV